MLKLLFYLIFFSLAYAFDDSDGIISSKNLHDFGYKTGLTLTSLDNTKQIYWRMPANVPIDTPHLKLHLTYNVQKGGADTFQVLINNHPIETFILPDHNDKEAEQETTLTVEVPPDILENGIASITFRFIGSTGSLDNTNICASSNYVKILPTSTFSTQFELDDLTHYHQTLPLLGKTITVLIAEKTIDAPLYRTALQISSRLKNLGFEVNFLSLPQQGEDLRLTPRERELYQSLRNELENGDDQTQMLTLQSSDDLLHWIHAKITAAKSKAVVITSAQTLNSFMKNDASLSFPAATNGVVSMIHGNEFLGLIVASLSKEDLHRFLVEFEQLLFNQQSIIKEISSDDQKGSFDTINHPLFFKDLNYPSTTNTFTLQTQWDYAFKLIDLPKGQPLKAIDLILNPGRPFSQLPLVLYIYFNNELLESMQLKPDEQGSKPLSILIPDLLLRTTNNLNVQVHQSPSSGLCRFSNSPISMQVSGLSKIYQGEAFHPPKTFVDMAHAFHRGFNLYLPHSVLENPEKSLDFLSSVAEIFPILALNDLVLYENQVSSPISAPFVLMGSLPPGQWNVPLALTTDTLKIYTTHNRQRFEIKTKDLMGSMIQLIHSQDAKNVHGLWIPHDQSQNFAKIKNLSLGDTDVVAFKPNGDVRFTLKNYQPQKSIFRLKPLEQIQLDFAFYTKIAAVLFWILAVLIIIKLLLNIKRKRHDRDK